MSETISERGCALVTGGSRGIGAATALGLAADGWAVAVDYRSDADAAERVVEQIRAAGGRATAIGVDVREADAPERLFTAIERELDRPVLVLVNNAGIARDGAVLHLDDETWDAVLDTNLSAAFRLTRRALRSMLGARFGRVVNVASVAAEIANPGQAAYAASKAGLIAFTRTTASEVARLRITVNAVAPGLVETEATEDVAAALVRRVPMRRAATPDEVADCIRFLASERASYVTGSVLTVDGGMTA